MNLPRINPTTTKAWKSLTSLSTSLKQHTIDALQAPRTLQTVIGELDFRYQRVTNEVLSELEHLIDETKLSEAKKAMLNGEHLNTTEQRATLHAALRTKTINPIMDHQPVQEVIYDAQQRLKQFTDLLHGNQHFTDVLHLGIGGSDLGPRSIVDALRFTGKPKMKIHYVSNVDGHSLYEALAQLNAKTTLIVIASKTFTTQETMLNAEQAKKWLVENGGEVKNQCIALTTNTELAKAFGISDQHLFGFWDWVGGRYSLWSSIGISIALAYGYDVFEQLLKGASVADQDFFYQDQNAATILALMSIWNTNFLNITTESAIVYDERLRLFPLYLQQLRMESNGKSVDRDGNTCTYQTNPILIPAIGTDSQHAFFQQFHQGTTKIAHEFYCVTKPSHPYPELHKTLLSHASAQAKAFALGDPHHSDPHKRIPGNHPSIMWKLNELTPFSLGYLYATQEHRTFVQGHILNINSFDQFGVELGKVIAKQLQNRA